MAARQSGHQTTVSESVSMSAMKRNICIGEPHMLDVEAKKLLHATIATRIESIRSLAFSVLQRVRQGQGGGQSQTATRNNVQSTSGVGGGVTSESQVTNCNEHIRYMVSFIQSLVSTNPNGDAYMVLVELIAETILLPCFHLLTDLPGSAVIPFSSFITFTFACHI
jgi:hypothetical protein